MKTKYEASYYLKLWNVVKIMPLAFYLVNKTGGYELDTAAMADYVINNCRGLIKNSVSSIIYGIPSSPLSASIARLIISHSNKGASVFIGKKLSGGGIFVNAGTSPQNKKIILSFTTSQNPDDNPFLKKLILLRVIQSDIKFVLDKNLSKNKKNLLPSVKPPPSDNAIVPKSNFERDFKDFIRKQGPQAPPLASARFLISSMPSNEAHQLNQSLLSRGISSAVDLEQLLNKWKDETFIHASSCKNTIQRDFAYER
jgi:hypothetical protein